MLTRFRNILFFLLILFLAAYAGLVVLYHQKTDDYAVGEARNQALNALLVHRATHTYVTRIQRPEIYRLKEEGKLYPGYFAPQVMSFTFISRNIKDLLNEERELRGLEPIYFKLASDNPRNPVNLADAAERDLLRRMNAGEINEIQKVVSDQGKKWLYLAVPIERSNTGCMKCHGKPADAPADLVAMYGDRAGFFESPNTIRALISIRVPLENILNAGDQMARALSLVTFLVLAGIYALLAFLIRHIDRQERRILGHNTELERLSMTDTLTGALNRFGLGQRGAEVLARARRFQHPLALLLLDLDHFKRVNDEHGHPAGDEVLRRFAATVRANLRVSDIFGRWGGEEFLVLAPHQTREEAIKLAEKLRRAIEAAEFPEGVRLTTSVGVSQCAPDQTLDALIERADRALYRAKEGGRNRVEADP